MSLDRILRAQPNNVEALFKRAQILMKAGQYREALTWTKRASTIQPNNPQLRYLLATNYYILHRPFETIRQLKKALKIKPNYSLARLQLAKTYCSIGRIDDAVKCIDAGAITTELPLERLIYADTLARIGRVDEAKKIILGEISIEQVLPAFFLQLIKLPGMHWTPDHVDLIETLLAKSEWSPDERASLHFSAAGIADHERRFDDAFAHYSQGNNQSESHFDISAYRLSVHRIIKLFTPDLFQAKAGFGNPSETPIFAIGLPRSGKSILESALCNHPQVHGVGEISLQMMIEPDLIFSLKPNLPDGFEEKIKTLDARKAKFASRDYMKEIAQYSKKSRFIVNTTPHNFQNIGLLNILFPNAKYIHVNRDPLDTCLFCFMKSFQYQHTYSQDLRIMGLYYKCYTDLMDHWKSVIPEKIIDVQYEKFVSEPADTLKSVLSFLDLDPDETLLDQAPAAGLETIEAGRETGPVNDFYVKYWKNYERQIGPLIDSLGDLARV